MSVVTESMPAPMLVGCSSPRTFMFVSFCHCDIIFWRKQLKGRRAYFSLRVEGSILASSSSSFSPWSHGPLLLGPHGVRQNAVGSTDYLIVDGGRD